MGARFVTHARTLDELRAEQTEIHVGYIPREMAADLRANGFPTERDIPATFSVSATGKPRVRLDGSF